MRRGAVRPSVRLRALLLMLAALLGIGALAVAATQNRDRDTIAERTDKPTLMLLTTLPIVFGEGFSLDGGGSPALAALERRYDVVPISTTAASELRAGKLLLMAHPLAQTAESLVDLDSWVRGGGRLLLLADPALDWESERPLGDALRPPPSFADTGLLKHWGLELYLPDERGPGTRTLRERKVATSSPGSLAGRCAISSDGLVARCGIGRGQVTVIADADFLNVEASEQGAEENLEALLAELDALERR